MAVSTTTTLNNGEKIPNVGIGTWDSLVEEEIVLSITTALESGYRHIDTAHYYNNEHIIGKVLRSWFDAGKLRRDDVFITSKLPPYGIHAQRVGFYLQETLTHLQLTHLDLYLIHTPFGFDPPLEGETELRFQPRTDFEGVWRSMEAEVVAGRTKSIGLSNFNRRQIETIVKIAKIKPAALQVECHLFLQQNELVEYCKANGIAFIGYAPFANPGTNKYRLRVGFPTKELLDVLGNETVLQIAAKHRKSPAQVALKFQLQRGIIVIPKSVTAKRVRENIDLFDFMLDEGDVKALKVLNMGEKGRNCDMKTVPNIANHPEYPFKDNC